MRLTEININIVEMTDAFSVFGFGAAVLLIM